jgi:hypothetical protein
LDARISIEWKIKTKRFYDLIIGRGENPLVEPGHDVLPGHQVIQRVHRVGQLIAVHRLLDSLQILQHLPYLLLLSIRSRSAVISDAGPDY